MRRRWIVGGLLHESNSFSPIQTPLESFGTGSEYGAFLRGEALRTLDTYNNCLAGFTERAERAGVEVIPTVYTEATPSAPCSQDTFHKLLSEITQALDDIDSPDLIYFDLHGAMLAEQEDDADATILETIRTRVGPDIPIVSTVDFHANLSERFLAVCDLVLPYRTYPHIDMRQLGTELADLCLSDEYRLATCRGIKHVPFMMPVNHQNTLDGPTRELLDYAKTVEVEDPGVLRLEVIAGFQPSDIALPVPTIYAYGYNAEAVNESIAAVQRKALEFESRYTLDYIRHEALADHLKQFGARDKPILVADAQDNPGGGGSSDTMFIARALLGTTHQCLIGNICDPDFVRQISGMAPGTLHEGQLGGATVDGDEPLIGHFRILATSTAMLTPKGTMLEGQMVDAGATGLVEIGNLRIVVTERRLQCLDRCYFLHFDQNPMDFDIIVLKSAVHYRDDFDVVSPYRVNVIAPGYEAMDFSNLPYTKLAQNVRFWGHGPRQSDI